MALSNSITEVADVIAKDLSSGAASRQSVGSPTAAFGWIGGLPITLASFVATLMADSLSIPITRVAPSGTPVTVVAAGEAKPAAVDIRAETITLAKHAGLATVNLEQTIDGGGLLNAITTVLGAGSLLSFESEAMARLAADAGQTATAGDWAAGIVAGQAKVLGAGGNPGVAVVSYSDYQALIGAIASSAGFSADPGSAIGSYLGSALHVSPRLAAGKAYVLDPQSVVAIQHRQSPVLISDPYSGAATNTVVLVSDMFATTAVMNDQHVCEVTVGA